MIALGPNIPRHNQSGLTNVKPINVPEHSRTPGPNPIQAPINANESMMQAAMQADSRGFPNALKAILSPAKTKLPVAV